MANLYLLDRLVPKHIILEWVADNISVVPWDYVVYTLPEDNKQYVWLNVWYPVEPADKKWKFVSILQGDQKNKFLDYQKKSR